MTTLVPSFLNGSTAFLQVTRTTIKACMSFVLVSTTDHRVCCPWMSKNNVFLGCYRSDVFNFADNDEILNILDVLEYQPMGRFDCRQ